MRLPRGRWTAAGLMGAALALLSALSIAAAEKGLYKTHEGGGVTIDVSFLPAEGEPKDYRFNVRMNTHSVPLADYDMVKLSFLRGGKGDAVRAKAWADPRGGGAHHRAGVLVFPAKDSDGNPIIGKTSRFMEVVIKGVAGIPERVFRWDLPLKTNSR